MIKDIPIVTILSFVGKSRFRFLGQNGIVLFEDLGTISNKSNVRPSVFSKWGLSPPGGN